MNRQHLAELSAFITVARERSFTRAAAQLGVTPSALSHGMRALEERLGLRLLNRTTRSVTPTEAGERLLLSVGPRLDEIDAEVAGLSALRDRPAGTVRISADENSMTSVLWPALRRVLPDYPDIHVEIVTDYTLTDIVAERFDAGVRFGEIVARDMISVPIGPEARMLAVASPGYFAAHGRPRTLEELTSIAASICGCRPMAASMRGNSSRTGASCACASRGSSSSRRSCRSFRPRSTASASPICRCR